MKKMQHKRKRIQTYKIEYKLPLKPSHRDGKHQFTLQSSKARSIRGFGEYITQLSLCINVFHHYVSLLNMVSYLSRCLIFLWKTGVLATEMALVLSHMRGTLSKVTSKSLMVCTIYRIWEQQLHTQPLWWIDQLNIVFEKTSKQETIRKNDKYQKCFFGQSHNPQNQHLKSQ
jgi:hypothetical protein